MLAKQLSLHEKVQIYYKFIYSFIHSSKFIKLANRSFGLLNRFQIEIEIHVNAQANICVYFKCPCGERKRIAIHSNIVAIIRLRPPAVADWCTRTTFEHSKFIVGHFNL